MPRLAPLAVLLALCAAGPAAPASARDGGVLPDYPRHGGWHVHAAHTTSGMNYCRLAGTNADGTFMFGYYLIGHLPAYLLLWQAHWAIPPDMRGEMEIRVDDAPPWRMTARPLAAVSSKLLMSPAPSAPRGAQLIDQLARGTMLTVRFPASGLAYAVSLGGSAAAIADLEDCRRRHAARGSAERAPDSAPAWSRP